MRLIDVVLSSRPYTTGRDAVRKKVLNWLEGDNARIAPGPPLLQVDQPSYAPMRVYADENDSTVRIGRYCSINETVTLMPGAEHYLDAVTTFFFYWAMGEGEPEGRGSKGPIIIGHDVCISRDALVLSGVTIGHGAVVGARALVTKSVAPFEIVGGVPARHIGWRFDEQIREELLRLAWWDWPVEKVLAHRTQLYGRGDAVVDFLARHGGKVDAMTSALPCEICDQELQQ